MRQIKFRGKNIHTGEWVVGDLLHIAGGCLIYFGSDTDTAEHDIERSNPIAVEFFKDEIAVVDPDSVGQFTGLLDKNGKEIYEGDVIRIDSHAWLDWKELDSVNAEVIFEEYMFDARWRNPDAGQPIPFHPDDDPDYESEYICEMLANLPNTIEVIGNRFDNPSLISDKQ